MTAYPHLPCPLEDPRTRFSEAFAINSPGRAVPGVGTEVDSLGRRSALWLSFDCIDRMISLSAGDRYRYYVPEIWIPHQDLTTKVLSDALTLMDMGDRIVWVSTDQRPR